MPTTTSAPVRIWPRARATMPTSATVATYPPMVLDRVPAGSARRVLIGRASYRRGPPRTAIATPLGDPLERTGIGRTATADVDRAPGGQNASWTCGPPRLGAVSRERNQDLVPGLGKESCRRGLPVVSA